MCPPVKLDLPVKWKFRDDSTYHHTLEYNKLYSKVYQLLSITG